MFRYLFSKIPALSKLSLVLFGLFCGISVEAQAMNHIQAGTRADGQSQTAPEPVILNFNQHEVPENNLSATTPLRNRSISYSSQVVSMPLLAESPDLMYQHQLESMGYDVEEEMALVIYPFNFGQFLIGQLTLAEYNNIWMSLRDNNLKDQKCKIYYRAENFIANGIQCISYFNYVEAHADSKGILSSISISGNQPEEHKNDEMIAFLSKRYRPLPYDKMPVQLKKLADLRQDLCNDLTKLMEGKFKCEEHWFYFRNFYLVFSPSMYQNHRKEQFTYGTLHHFTDYEIKMVKRRLAIVRQELNAKLQDE